MKIPDSKCICGDPPDPECVACKGTGKTTIIFPDGPPDYEYLCLMCGEHVGAGWFPPAGDSPKEREWIEKQIEHAKCPECEDSVIVVSWVGEGEKEDGEWWCS